MIYDDESADRVLLTSLRALLERLIADPRAEPDAFADVADQAGRLAAGTSPVVDEARGIELRALGFQLMRQADALRRLALQLQQLARTLPGAQPELN